MRIFLILLLCILISQTSGQDVNITDANTNATESNSNQTTIITTSEEPQCSFPSGIAGTWLTSFWGQVEVTAGEILSLDIGHQTDYDMQCYQIANDGSFALRSRQMYEHYGDNINLWTCLKFVKNNNDSYQLLVKTSLNTRFNEPVIGRREDYDVDIEDNICGVSDADARRGIMIRAGREMEASTGLPAVLNGTYTVTLPDSLTCPDGALANTCNEPNTLTFNFSTCGEGSSSSDKLDYLSVGHGDMFVYLFLNTTQNTAFSGLSCLTLSSENGTLRGVHEARPCEDTWNSNVLSVQTETLDFNSTGSCIVEQEEETTTPISLGGDLNSLRNETTENVTNDNNATIVKSGSNNLTETNNNTEVIDSPNNGTDVNVVNGTDDADATDNASNATNVESNNDDEENDDNVDDNNDEGENDDNDDNNNDVDDDNDDNTLSDEDGNGATTVPVSFGVLLGVVAASLGVLRTDPSKIWTL